jgi:hypothetical protein
MVSRSSGILPRRAKPSVDGPCPQSAHQLRSDVNQCLRSGVLHMANLSRAWRAAEAAQGSTSVGDVWEDAAQGSTSGAGNAGQEVEDNWY